MRLFSEILKLIFCPLWFFYNHNANEKITQTKKEYIKYVIIVLIVLLILLIVYLREIVGLFK